MDFSKLPIRRLSTTINVFKNDRRTWKPYYNNRHGWQRSFEKYRSYYVREHDHKQILGAQMEAHGVDLDWRIRNKCPSAPAGKWELWNDEKRRVQYQPEYHPALENSVPDFSFADGTPQEKSREVLIAEEKNRMMVKQIVKMYSNIEKSKIKPDEEKEPESPWTVKGTKLYN